MIESSGSQFVEYFGKYLESTGSQTFELYWFVIYIHNLKFTNLRSRRLVEFNSITDEIKEVVS